ncbi:hypothetical protein EV356DRAFT_511606 [Viridothelium virens]|uniref:HAUS augmin-like complex subunit 1 n=1 Tax=Viridothelium virens TaxID=1048519 RepID=A0A6A6HH75_VIRVR|nr:hypothetical protein EV356DRAFT_511606 [Viridothelium virens]
MDEDWTASHFSPSKARQQRALAKDWEYVQVWLGRKFAPKPVPSFERNEDTLKALLELASFNDAADEELALISAVHADALKELQDVQNNDDLIETITGALTDDGHESLNALAELSVGLNAPNVHPQTLAKNAVDLTEAEFDIEQQCRQAKAIAGYLEAELERLGEVENDLKSDAFTAPSELGSKTLDWTRGTKQLKAKVTEYRDRLNSLSDAVPDKPNINELINAENHLASLKKRLMGLEKDVKSFVGLPHDKDLARFKVAEANQELQDLRKKRDHRFEALVEK